MFSNKYVQLTLTILVVIVGLKLLSNMGVTQKIPVLGSFLTLN